MARTSRAETQERNRARVLAAAREEFAERGYRDAKVDAIAQRVGLTRGAVYSNFPGKRALYFAVLADLAEQAFPPAGRGGAFAESGPEGGAFAHRQAAGGDVGAFGGGPGADGAGLAAGGESWGGVASFSPARGSSGTQTTRTEITGPRGSAAEVRVAGAYQRVLGALALAWVQPLVAEDWLGRELLPELVAEDLRRPYTQLLKLDALLLGLALERLRPHDRTSGTPPVRMVRHAEVLLGTLHGATGLAAVAPGFLEPYDVVSALEKLAGLALNDYWSTPPAGPPVRPVQDPWQPPPAADLVRGTPVDAADGVVAILGLNRLAAAEEAVRCGADTTVVLVTSSPRELAPLARFTVAQLTGPLRQAFPAEAWPRVRVVCDESGAFARAAGVPAVSDETETAVLVGGGLILTRADGFAACHAVASA